MKYEVYVELKGDVLDVQGRAIRETLLRLGHTTVSDIKASKRFVVELSNDAKNGRLEVEQIAKEFLANSVAETFFIKEL